MTPRIKLAGTVLIVVIALIVAFIVMASRSLSFVDDKKTEADVTFAQALEVFDLPVDISLIGDYKYSQIGFMDNLFQFQFITNSEGIESIKTEHLLSATNVSTNKADEDWWDPEVCLGEEAQHKLEVSDMSHATIFLCPLSGQENEWQVYLVGGTT